MILRFWAVNLTGFLWGVVLAFVVVYGLHLSVTAAFVLGGLLPLLTMVLTAFWQFRAMT